MKDFSYITNSSPAYIESLYKEFLDNPGGIDPEMKKFFEGFDFSQSQSGSGLTSGGDPISIKETQVRNLIFQYRSFGHLKSKTNPVRERRDHNVNLDHKSVGLTDADLDVLAKAAKRNGVNLAE